MDISKTDEVRSTIEEMFDATLAEENIILSRVERQRLFEQIAAEILGYGPLEPLLSDETITRSWSTAPRKSILSAEARSNSPMLCLKPTTI